MRNHHDLKLVIYFFVSKSTPFVRFATITFVILKEDIVDSP